MKTSLKRRCFLIAAGIAAAVIVILAAFAAGNYVQTSKYQKQIEVATHYWEQEDYVNARVAFSAALKMDDTKEDAYVGLVQVYHALGDDDMAARILAEGLSKTPGLRLTVLQQSLQMSGLRVEEDETTAPEVSEQEVTPALNTSLLEMLGTNSYDNYRARYGIESCDVESDSCDVRVNNVAAVMHFYPTEEQPEVLASGGDKPVEELRPTAVTLDDVSLLFGGSKTVTFEQIQAFRVGDLSIREDDTHGHILQFTAKNCTVQIACDENGTVTAGAWNSIEPAAAEQEDGEGMQLSGKVISAVSANGVSGAELTFTSRKNRDDTYTIEADSFGRYELKLPSGDYSVTIRCSGYTEETFDCTVSSYTQETARDFTITPILEEGQIRIVLTWGSNPTDLDSYLSGTTDSGVEVYTSFRNRTCTSNGQTIAELDVDDTDGYGPETTTIYDVNGVYEFRVVDFTGSGTMSSSGAVVKVYTSDSGTPVEIPICSGLENGWFVCRIDHGEVTVVNTSSSTRSGAAK